MIKPRRHTRRNAQKQAACLLNQQIWCFGRDIMRPEGNWLIELGFERFEPPAKLEGCPSIYMLNLPEGRCVVLRGFGIFYGDPQRGVVFLQRYEFAPRFTPHATLKRMPWTVADVRGLRAPTACRRTVCASLTVDAIDWMRSYEADVIERLGLTYRRSTLANWDNDKRPVMAAEAMVPAWRKLSVLMADDLRWRSD
ncbi:MAG: hypothetical protein AAGD32_08135 [Planctomycetota bacterium]